MSNLQHERETIEQEIRKLEQELEAIKKEEVEARTEIKQGEQDLQKDLMEKTRVSTLLQRERGKLILIGKREAAEIKDKHTRMDRAA